ncbi:MAG: pectate lyase [Phycisphaerae bacterium]|nr:pectate lyase [Phycisphaerae bacterium]
MKNSHTFRKIIICTSLLISLLCCDLFAEPNTPPQRPRRMRNPWAEYAQKPDSWYKSEEGLRIANNILSWQSSTGSWPKNQSTTNEPFIGDTNSIEGTFDNNATTSEIRFLARAFRATGDKRYKNTVIKGINNILKAQYPNGGFPQYYPLRSNYSHRITFNDNCMVRLMELLRDVADSPDFKFLDAVYKNAAKKAFSRGIDCILKCQIKTGGKLTVWCAQHDENTLEPQSARSYELASLSGLESVGIIKLLMSIDKPSPEVIQAVKAGAEWFESSKITGIRLSRSREDRIVELDPNAPPIWARFYEIETGRPFFCGRDGIKKYSLAEIEQERRARYAWYGYWGNDVAKSYAEWKQKHKQ